MEQRLNKLRKQFAKHDIEAFIISNPINCTYLSGFKGTAVTLVVNNNNAYLLTDFRYLEQAREQSPNFTVIDITKSFYSELIRLFNQAGVNKVGVESDYLTYQQFTTLNKKVGKIKFIPINGAVHNLRMIKELEEVALIKKSMHILDKAFNHIIGKLKPGVTEKEIALELEFFARSEGAEEKAFPFIVASGPRSSLPHGTASNRVIQYGDLVTIDFGVVFNGYNSDMTRTIVIGKPDKKQKDIYNIVLEAQLVGLDKIRAGLKASEIDNMVRTVIEQKGYGSYFGHSTGHGIGLEVHEKPRLSDSDETVLEDGMVVTVEPGIYIPKWGGVRIEDTVLVQKTGCKILCSSPKSTLIPV